MLKVAATFTDRKIFSRKALIFWGILALLLCSVVTTLLNENVYADGLSIAVSVVAGIGLFFTMIFLLIDAILAVCNP